jgi:hypothetical protein
MMNRRLVQIISLLQVGLFWVGPMLLATALALAQLTPPKVATTIALCLYACEGVFWATRPDRVARRKQRRLTRHCS